MQAEGLAEFYQKKPWWEGLIEGIRKLFPFLGGGGNNDGNNGGFNLFNPFTWGRTGNNGDGKGKTDGVTPKSTMLPAKQDAVSGSYDSFLGGRPAFTSGFGLRNTGIQGASTDHQGIDIGVDAGAEVKAIESGKVVDIYKDFGGWGDGLVIQHADGSKNVYGHIESSVGIGDEVKAGDKVGLIKYWPSEHYPAGRQHLHLERIESGTKVDPQTYLNNLMSADQADVDGDVEKIKKNPQVEALTSLMGTPKKKGKVEVAGVGSFARTNPRGSKFETFYRDTEGNRIGKDEFMSRLRSAQADPSSALNKASTEVASGDRAAANGSSTPAIVPLETGGKPQSTQPSAPAPAPASGDILPSTLRAVQVATAQ